MISDAHLDRLVVELASADPRIRDEQALPDLGDAIVAGDLTAVQRHWLGTAMVERLEHPEIQARTFAPLVLAILTETGDTGPRWVEEVARWYLAEQDLRGHDEQLGWLHAVAHGADFFQACARHPEVAPAPLLATLAARLLADTAYVLRDQEDDRVAYAMACVLTDSRLSATDATAWLTPVRAVLASGTPGPVPPRVSNTLHTLRALHVLLHQPLLVNGESATVPHADAVRRELAATLHPASPWMWAPASS